MTMVFRFEPDRGVPRGGAAVPAQHKQAETHELGAGMRIVASPWEGIYLEQAYSFLSGSPERKCLSS